MWFGRLDDLLTEIQARDPLLARKVYLLEDCTSPVVVLGVVDFTEQGDARPMRGLLMRECMW